MGGQILWSWSADENSDSAEILLTINAASKPRNSLVLLIYIPVEYLSVLGDSWPNTKTCCNTT